MTIEIQPQSIGPATVRVPGSKSYTHRTLIAAGLADGESTVVRPLLSEDSHFTMQALAQMGVTLSQPGGTLTIVGCGGRPAPSAAPIELGNSGTSMRLLTAVAALGQGAYTLTGTPRMQERPIRELGDALNALGVPITYLGRPGCPPITVQGGRISADKVSIDCRISSQYLSGLLLTAPCTLEGMEIEVVGGPVSKPYIDMTVEILECFGIRLERDGYRHFTVPGGQTYRPGAYTVAPDASQAGYFWAAAAISGTTITVKDVHPDAVQGDVRLAEVFGQMGCRVTATPDGIAVTGADLRSVAVDMGDMPDMVPTLAVVAAFAKGTTVMTNVAHLRAKECDRLAAVESELAKMGIEARSTADTLSVTGGTPHGAEIETYDDHRIAMCFAVAGLRVPGVRITNPDCVAKSFPNFWEVFGGLASDHRKPLCINP
ncbi:MAG: 3-phosphoshikimate 1-carboxyvinyltransferase [Desulfosarcinaceae bacterium]|nr:3-phosphoshikimate 1-carboxyvinyltransferase [Desulfosarcinaceae bacterium]